jgi:hypothetical protein
MAAPEIRPLPPSIVTFPCDECGREFVHRYGYAIHRPCGPVRQEMAAEAETRAEVA